MTVLDPGSSESARKPSIFVRMWRSVRPTLQYVLETEVHVYAFSIAANVLLSFWPFLIVLKSICRYILQWPAAERAIDYAVRDFFPGDTGMFITGNINRIGLQPLELPSILLLLFTANGIFEPLEVALNRAWGVKENRTFLRNQMVSMGLIFACGLLALLSVGLTALSRDALPGMNNFSDAINGLMQLALYKAAALPISILVIFLVYWLLPNRKIKPKHVIAPAIFVGLALEALKYISLVTAPFFYNKFDHEYSVFKRSVSIIFWSFLAALVMLAGAELTARFEARRTGKLHDTQRIKPPAPVPASAPE